MNINEKVKHMVDRFDQYQEMTFLLKDDMKRYVRRRVEEMKAEGSKFKQQVPNETNLYAIAEERIKGLELLNKAMFDADFDYFNELWDEMGDKVDQTSLMLIKLHQVDDPRVLK